MLQLQISFVFLNLITDKKKGGFYTASNFILGKQFDKKRKEVTKQFK